jgi:SRSO17 transposase
MYVHGLLFEEDRNLERISETMNTNYFQMQHFITESNWSARQLMDEVAREVSDVLPKNKLTALIIDESGWTKKGEKSVGVGRQYCGNVGKVANCQVAVFASLSNGDYSSLIDARLYLPEDWCNDPERCDEAGIPEDERTFRTKAQLAWEIIEHQAGQTDFDFVSADGFYGNDAELARRIDEAGYLYMLDIHSDQTIYLSRPELHVPSRKSDRGRTPQKLKASTIGTTAYEYLQTLQPEQWQKITVRNTAKGVLTGFYHFVNVWIWNKAIDRVEPRLLVIRKTYTPKGEEEIQYSFTNANLDQYTPQGLAYMQAERFFVEHSIKESKQILGLDQFQTRKWNAWQHQVALNFLVSSFILKEKLLNREEIPLLSAKDVKELVIFQLYRQMTDEQMYHKIIHRHIKRQKDINRAYLRQNTNLSK